MEIIFLFPNLEIIGDFYHGKTEVEMVILPWESNLLDSLPIFHHHLEIF